MVTVASSSALGALFRVNPIIAESRSPLICDHEIHDPSLHNPGQGED